MKVLLVANINSSHTRKWALALIGHGLKVAVFSIDPALPGSDWYKQLEMYFAPEKKDRFLPRKYFKLYRQLKKMRLAFQPDIVHSHFVSHYSFLANYLGFKPHVATAWGSDVYAFPNEGPLQKRILKYNLKKASALVSTSRNMAAEMKTYVNREVHIIPFGIDFNLFPAREGTSALQGKKIKIACFKKIEPIYGHDILLKTFVALCDSMPGQDLHLIIAGNGSSLNQIKTMASHLRISSQISFTGWVEPDKVPALLKDVDICVYLSRHESFGVSLLESMAAKIPLVVSETPGFLEVIRDGNKENALVVPVDDPKKAAECIRDLIMDQELYKRLAEGAYHHALEHFELKKNIDAQISLYKQLLDKKHK